MYGSVDASLLVDKHFRELHEAVLAKAKQNGRVLTLDGSNEDDEELYSKYFKEVRSQSHTSHSFHDSSWWIREMMNLEKGLSKTLIVV